MNKCLIVLAAALAATAVRAEDGDELEGVATNAAPAAKTFTSLPLCRRIDGEVLVRKPGADWAPAEEGRFYPFGSAYCTKKGGRLELSFGSAVTMTLESNAQLGTREQEIGCPSRTAILMGGTVHLKVPNNLPENLFFVTAPGFTVKNPAGESTYLYADKGDGDEATVRCKTGSLGVSGRHFDLPAMHAANEVRIRTSRDHLVSSLTGAGGDYVVNVDQGIRLRDEFGDDGQIKQVVEKDPYECHLTPGTRILINRMLPAIGERMSVHTMIFEASGEKRSERYFCEGRAEINSGELVVKGKLTSDELAKRAAEVEASNKAAEEVEETAADDDSSDEDSSSESEE